MLQQPDNTNILPMDTQSLSNGVSERWCKALIKGKPADIDIHYYVAWANPIMFPLGLITYTANSFVSFSHSAYIKWNDTAWWQKETEWSVLIWDHFHLALFERFLEKGDSSEYQRRSMEDNACAESIFHVWQLRFTVHCVSWHKFWAVFQQVATTQDQQHQNSFVR